MTFEIILSFLYSYFVNIIRYIKKRTIFFGNFENWKFVNSNLERNLER